MKVKTVGSNHSKNPDERAMLRSSVATGLVLLGLAALASAEDVKYDYKPVADAGDDMEQEVDICDRDAPVWVELDGSRSYDPNEDDVVTFSWRFTSVPRSSRLLDSDILQSDSDLPKFRPDAPGNYRLELTVSDGCTEVQDRVSVSIIADECKPADETCGFRPIANAGRDQRIVGDMHDVNNTYVFHFDACESSDTDEKEVIRFNWAFQAKPPQSELRDTDIEHRDSCTPFFIPDVPGEYELRLDVADSCSEASDLVSGSFFQVGPKHGRVHDYNYCHNYNQAPSARAGPNFKGYIFTDNPGKGVTLDGTRSVDPEGTDLTCSWKVLAYPDDMEDGVNIEIDDASACVTDFHPPTKGCYEWLLTVTDGCDSDHDAVQVCIQVATPYVEPEPEPVYIPEPEPEPIWIPEPEPEPVYIPWVDPCEGNTAPVASAGPDRRHALSFKGRGKVWIGLDTSGTGDEDLRSGWQHRLISSWEVLEKPDDSKVNSGSFEEIDTNYVAFAPDKVGNYRFRLTVNDGCESDSSEVSVVIERNLNPGVPDAADYGDCCEEHDTPRCSDKRVMECTCKRDSHCCQATGMWDAWCVHYAQECGACTESKHFLNNVESCLRSSAAVSDACTSSNYDVLLACKDDAEAVCKPQQRQVALGVRDMKMGRTFNFGSLIVAAVGVVSLASILSAVLYVRSRRMANAEVDEEKKAPLALSI